MSDQVKTHYFYDNVISARRSFFFNGLFLFIVVLLFYLKNIGSFYIIIVAAVLLIIITTWELIFYKNLYMITIDLAEKKIGFGYSHLNGRKSVQNYEIQEIEATYLLENSFSTRRSLNEEVLKIKKGKKEVISITTGKNFHKDVISEIYNHIFIMKRNL